MSAAAISTIASYWLAMHFYCAFLYAWTFCNWSNCQSYWQPPASTGHTSQCLHDQADHKAWEKAGLSTLVTVAWHSKSLALYPAVPAFFRLQKKKRYCERKTLGRLGSRLANLCSLSSLQLAIYYWHDAYKHSSMARDVVRSVQTHSPWKWGWPARLAITPDLIHWKSTCTYLSMPHSIVLIQSYIVWHATSLSATIWVCQIYRIMVLHDRYLPSAVRPIIVTYGHQSLS